LALPGALIDQPWNFEKGEVRPQTGFEHLIPEVQVPGPASGIS
jgi:hypothetical protein